METAGSAPSTLDRRSALKVALAGATAAAVWSAPKVEGLALVPDYAAAASCAVPQESGTMAKNSVAKSCSPPGSPDARQICWGTATCSNGGSSGTAVCGTANLGGTSVQKPFGGTVTLGGQVAGRVYTGPATGATEDTSSRISGLNLTGIDSSVTSCTLDVNGGCSDGAFLAGTNPLAMASTSSQELFADGPFGDVFIKCVGTHRQSQTAAFNVTLVCTFSC